MSNKEKTRIIIVDKPEPETSSVANFNHSDSNQKPEIIGLNNYLGLHFKEKSRIVLFQSISGKLMKSPYWEALLSDKTQIKLSNNITAEKILSHLSKDHFFQINQSAIINLAFLGEITYKTHECRLIPPFDHIKLTISRPQLIKLKEIFEIL